jgi:TorA maturation chaperone TorD
MNQDWLPTLAAQGLAFGFFSKVFYEKPSTSLIQTMVRDDLFSDWPLNPEAPEMQAGLNLLRDFCAQWDDSQIEALEKDYAALLIGPDKLLAPPWESVYRSNEGLIFEQQTLEVREAYARFGLQTPRLHNEPDDHIGLELAFMVHLCSLGMSAVQFSQPEQWETVAQNLHDFLDQHLLRWAPDFCAKVAENAKTEYYRGAALLLDASLKTAAQQFGIEVEAAS